MTNISRGSALTPQPPSVPEGKGIVSGTLVDQDGAPIAGTPVSLVAVYVRDQAHLGDAITAKSGEYTITYDRPKVFNLAVRATDASGKTIAQSPTVFAAPAHVQIDFTTAPAGVVRQPSTFTKLSTEIAAQLGDTPLTSLQEDKDKHELQFLASSIGAHFDDVAYMFIAAVLGHKHQLWQGTLFGIFHQGIPPALHAALANLPDAGIDDAFTAQVFIGVLAQTRASLNHALTADVKANVLPASYAAAQSSELDRIDALRIQSVGTAAYVRGKTALNDVLVAGKVKDAVKMAFLDAYAANNGQLGPTWKTLRANKKLPAADLKTLNTTLSLGELLTGNLPLINDTWTRLSQGTLAHVQDLALLDEADWVARITAVDPQATSIPQVLPNDTPQQRIQRFAKALTARFASRYPTTAFAGGLFRSTSPAFANTKEELFTFLKANPTLSFRQTNIDQFISTKKLTISPPALADLKTAQRLFRLSPHYATVDALKTAGYTSAQSIYFKGRGPFLAEMTSTLGSASLAKMAYARAQMTYATALMAFGRYNLSLNGINLPVFGNPAPDPQALTNLPDLQALFGSLDYFQCDDCQSVYSPAAYLVDLLQYLVQFPASGGGVTNARDALFLRRPEIQYIALDCNNTNTTLPYIDLVNEIFEAAIAPPKTPVTLIDTTGTSAERRALPQQISQAAYALTAQEVFPLPLPFDLAFAQTTAYIAALGTNRAAILSIFAGNPVPAAKAPAIACATLGINPEMQAVINGSDTHHLWERWGLAQNPASVIDPKTGQPYSPNPADWVAALSKVPVLLNRSGLTLQQLYQLLEVVWVTQSGVTLQPGTTSSAGLQILSADTDLMIFKGLTADVLDRANRFLRLWNASGLQMWELDWALEAASGGSLNDAFLVFLTGAIAVAKQLRLPLQEALSFWMPLETRDVVNHLGDEDTVTPSTYSEVFRNPAVLATWNTIFVPVNRSTVTGASNTAPITVTTAFPHGYQTGQSVSITGIGGNTAANGTFTITVVSPTTFTLNGSTGNGAWTSGGVVTGLLSGNVIISAGAPTPEQNAITAALALSADDTSAILACTGAKNALSLDTLNVLLRYQRLASSLSLEISDLIMWIQLTTGTPFGAAPADTVEFLRRLAVLRGTGLASYDVDYLIRGQHATQSSLALTTSEATAILQAIRDAIAKLPTPVTIAVTGASNTTPITISTALPNGLQTGMQVTITGVLGNTAANGTFTISVTSPTSFTLNGSAGNGNWTSGGVITVNFYTASAIQTVFVNALATATSTTANVVTPVLLKTAILPLSSATISQLLAQTSGVESTQFPALINAFTSVAKAAALFTALKPSESEFAFVVQNAASFNWLDPSALPISPVTASPYNALEALLRALKLDRRQPALTPKLFDVFNAWLPTNTVPPDLNTAIGGPALTAVSNSTPIAITTASPHYLETGMQVTISAVQGNTAANGVFTVTVTGPSTFTLNGSAGSGTWTGGGAISGLPCIALALNAAPADMIAIANALGATAPSLVPANLPGSLADVGMLTAIASALDILVRYGIGGASLVQLSAAPATAASASAASGALQAQYAQSNWFGAIQPVEDNLRQARRDALVAYLLGPGPATSTPPFFSTNDIYNYYLIDPEMSPCGLTTRLLQASLAIQQFMQQCFLNLSFSNVKVDMSNADLADEWSWRQQYRLWQANREVFLYPENYVLPELRKDKSSFFSDLESDLQQSTCDKDAAEAAIGNYLRKLVGVARLRVAAHYNQTLSDGSTVLHVFAATNATPPQWFYRTRTSQTPDSGTWSPWQSLNLDIASQHLLPVIWDQRLHLVWPVFKPISEKQSDQDYPAVPTSGGPAPAPQKFWSVEFAMSELSAGQWQAKQTIIDNMFFKKNTTTSAFDIDRSPMSFTFRASQDSTFNLHLDAYYNATATEIFWSFGEIAATGQVAAGMLPMPESLLSVVELANLLPDSSLVDSSQEPTYSLVTTGTFSASLTAPANYFFLGQDLVYGGLSSQSPGYPSQILGSVPLNVLCAVNSKGQVNSIELLGSITNPRTVVPVQEPVFDSADPFFVADPMRTYLVQPEYYTISSQPQELTNLKYISQWNTKYVFQTFYHPYARTFLRELEIGGVDQLMARNLQVNPQAIRGWTPNFDFNALYHPQPPVATPYPGASGAPDPGETALDFASGSRGAYSEYNWETFYHIPMYVSSLVLQNAMRAPAGADQQFKTALAYLEYIFNPTDSSGGPTPQRYWQMAPFNAMNASDWTNQQIQVLLATLAADTQQGISDSATTTAINNWMLDPFDPHAIASLRISAYAKATVMKMFDVLIAWGDWYYSQYTAEMVSQAEQLYILVDMILGPKPSMLRLPNAEQGGAGTATYASLKNIDAFSNILVNVENVIVAPEPPAAIVQGTAQIPSLPQFPGSGNASTLLFCIPPNDQLLAYWDKISQRLYNIRHCLNLQGQPQPLPLYAPPINPLALIEAAAAGEGFSAATPPAPVYKFAIYLQKAIELTNDVRAYGELILSALEKQDAETLAVLRANQELDIQTRILDVKNLQVQEAQDQITALQNQQAVVQIRSNFYSNIAFMNTWEGTALALQAGALIANGVAVVLDMTAGTAHLIPSFEFGAEGFGGSPTVTASFGGKEVGDSAGKWANVSRGLATILNEAGAMAATMGAYQRRMDEWNLQAQLAGSELTQIASQITAATDRLNIANKEVAIQNAQISNAQAVSDFLTNKYTNAQLYNWMVTQLTTVYTQAYQLAFSLALQAQNAYQYELGSQDTFIQFGYWDSQHKGLTAGESLLFDLRRMEAQYLAENTRELELTKHISLVLTNPLALVTLRETGTCQIALDETLFEYDYPGQYFRRLRSVALTIPCVTGPYTGVNATLTLTNAMVRTQSPGASYKPQPATAPPNDPSVINSPVAAAGMSTIATSTGQNDSGLFEMNLSDERWPPFSGQGAISTWNLVLDPRDNNFDFTTITDVVMHVRYTARGGGDQTAANNVRAALKPQGPRSILISVRNTFPNAYYVFFNPSTTPATTETLTLPFTNSVIPFSNLGAGVKIESIAMYVALSTTASGNTIPATFGPTGGTMSGLSLTPSPWQTTAGNPVNALTANVTLAPPLTAPQSLTLSVPVATLPPALTVTSGTQTLLDQSKVDDILLIVTYSIG